MNTKRMLLCCASVLALAGCDTKTSESNQPAASATAPESPPEAVRTFPTRPLFGDTHLHTSFSMDAGAFGTRLTPADAYRFAKGEEVTSNTGQRAKLVEPLDFLVVADHSDGMGLFPLLLDGDPIIMADEQGRRWHEMIMSGKGPDAAREIIQDFGAGAISEAILPVPGSATFSAAWEKTVQAAEDANDPGNFTAFIGYEWTSNTKAMNLHRNVIFRDGGDKARMIVPLVATPPHGSDNPEDLWDWLEDYEAKTGGQVLAIAHNGNLSNGKMFPVLEAFGEELDAEYAQERKRWEPLYETTQTKGDGETHPLLSTNDEFADFETWDKGNLDGTQAKTPEMLEFEYARSALKNGLKLEQKLGTNPYQFGLIGSSDAHTGLAAMEESNFYGKMATQEPGPERMSGVFFDNPDTGVRIMDWETGSSGYAAVWAAENTRESIFDAMERRETYGTTGSRMIVRFFGGWNLEPGDASEQKLVAAGYDKGVPMGGELQPAAGKAPSFLVHVEKDPNSGNLDRVQIVKGWMDADGWLNEQVYNVAWSDPDKRPKADDGSIPPVGNTVDFEKATWTNDIGAPSLTVWWQDPDFDPTQSAFYYVRVLEIPTPRWTSYDISRYGVKPLEGTRLTIQERAYTSPIWYTP